MNREQLLLRCVVSYNQETGHFTWLRPQSPKLKEGDRAGSPHGKGYRRVEVLGRRVYEHRLAWFYMMGEWPAADIDHINGVRDDNRWANLRSVSRSENNLNLRGNPKGHTRSGVLGVSVTKSGTYFARLKVDGNVKYLGCFKTAEQAGAAYQAALAQK